MHRAVQEGGRAKATAFGGGSIKGGNLKVIQCLWPHPRDGPILQLPGETDTDGTL